MNNHLLDTLNTIAKNPTHNNPISSIQEIEDGEYIVKSPYIIYSTGQQIEFDVFESHGGLFLTCKAMSEYVKKQYCSESVYESLVLQQKRDLMGDKALAHGIMFSIDDWDMEKITSLEKIEADMQKMGALIQQFTDKDDDAEYEVNDKPLNDGFCLEDLFYA